MEEFPKQQQHNIDESAEMELLNMDHLQSDQTALLERQQQKTDQKALNAPIDQGTSQLMEECQNQQQQNIDALTEGRKGNVEIVGNMGKIENLVAILTSAGQWWRRYDLYRIVGAIVLLIFIIYTVHQLNQQNEKLNEIRLEMAESLKSVQAMVGAEMENGNFAMAAYEEEEQTKLEELKLLREKIKRFELNETKGIDPYRIVGAIVLFIFIIYTVHRLNALTEAQKRNGLIPQQNRWDSAACHKDLALTELIVQRNGEANWGFCSVLAVEPIPKEYCGISYFELKILKNDSGGIHSIHIGLANKQMPLDKHVGAHDGTYAYGNYGYFWGHEVAGCSHNSDGRPYINGKPRFDVGDVIGCGVHLATRQIIYTLNGQRLETAGLFVTFAGDLFAFVSLNGPGAEIEANFGPNFEYKF